MKIEFSENVGTRYAAEETVRQGDVEKGNLGR
jgi:hypothetical protein